MLKTWELVCIGGNCHVTVVLMGMSPEKYLGWGELLKPTMCTKLYILTQLWLKAK